MSHTDTDAKDRDETRRLLYAALLAIRAGRRVGDEMAGTILNAIAHHSKLCGPEYAESLCLALASCDGEHDDARVVATLHALIHCLTEED